MALDDQSRRILRLLQRDARRPYAEIAAELYLSVPTVKAHVSRLFEKLGTANRVQIAMCVHDAGLV